MIQGGTAAAQHRRYFMRKGNFSNPRDIFRRQLITQMREWRSKGNEIILFADLNENIYTGPLSQALQQQGLLMEEQTLKSTGRQAPYSHQSGKTPIVGTFATPGILCTNSYLSPHGSGVGDHRFQLHDFDADSVLGSEYPKTVRPTGRALRCKVVRTRKKYIKKLKKGFTKHRIYEKLEYLHLNKSTIPRGEFQQRFNSWDREVTQLKMGSEKSSNQFFNGTIEFSPLVGILVRNIRVYRWIEHFKAGKPCNKKNLWQTCKRQQIPLPPSLMQEEVTHNINEYTRKLADLRERSPKLREEHLALRLEVAWKKNKKIAVKGIINIICREASRKQ
jgi:hypothetical protein